MAEATVSLYLDLERGSVADLEVVAKASLAFVAAIREAAYTIDPSTEVAIGISSGTEGSLSLNTIIKAIKAAKDNPASLSALAILALVWFGGQTTQYGFTKVADHVLGQDNAALTKAQRHEVVEMVKRGADNPVAQSHVSRVYRELEADRAVIGVGATTEAGKRPEVVIPRSDFPSRSGASLVIIDEESKRKVVAWERVMLISPVLIPHTKRRWKFLSSFGEFGASIKDADFVDSVVDGKFQIPLEAGIELDVKLETVQEQQDGVWVTTERNILEVGRRYRKATQASLLSHLKPNNAADEEDEQGSR